MTLKAAVIGAGAMGRHHVRVYGQIPDVTLVGVADPDPARREPLARQFHIPTYASHEELLDQEQPDLVSVVVPTALHREVVEAALAHGAHILVEKPIAPTVEDARALIMSAAAAGRVLAVGHIERFNPAIAELRPRLAQGEIGALLHLHAQRLSPFPAYIHDIGVVMDLATHELDLFATLAGSPVARVYAETGRNVHAAHEDMLSAMLRSENGVLGVLDINWLTPVKVRELRITGERGMFVVDYIGQDLFFYENRIAPSRWDAMALFRGVEEGNMVKIRVAKLEPLEAELRAFVAAARGLDATTGSGHQGIVTGVEGLRAVALATLLIEAGREGRVVCVADEARRRGWHELLGTASPGG
jgi:predicted dehydrogenase